MAGGFYIQPYIGVGALHFGMEKSEVESLVGPPIISDTGFLGEATEYRRGNELLTTYDQKNHTLVEIGIGRRIVELEYEGMEIFTMPPLEVLRKLIELDGSPFECVGFIVLLELGMTLTGFHDGDIDQKAVTVFERGRWSDLIPDLKPFVMDGK